MTDAGRMVRHWKLEQQPMLAPLQDDLERRPIAGCESMVMEVRLAKGFEVPRHNHPEEQFTYMISGSLMFWTDDEPDGFVVGPGDLVHFPPDAYHRAEALEDVVELDIFCPIRPALLAPLSERVT
jgi:quercetin dioxygenase-like cupin family protein